MHTEVLKDKFNALPHRAQSTIWYDLSRGGFGHEPTQPNTYSYEGGLYSYKIQIIISLETTAQTRKAPVATWEGIRIPFFFGKYLLFTRSYSRD